jgi:N-acetylglucosamine-6-sulfatase
MGELSRPREATPEPTRFRRASWTTRIAAALVAAGATAAALAFGGVFDRSETTGGDAIGPSSASGAQAAGGAAGRPNVVVLMTDDQTLESLRVMRNVDGLLTDEGTTFAQNVVSFSLCCPSRATFLTGQYAHNHGVRENGPPNGGYDKLDHSETLPVWLHRAGYRTAFVGKYMNFYGLRDPLEIPPGWDEWYAALSNVSPSYYDYTVNENGELVEYGDDAASYQTDVDARRAVDIIDRLAVGAEPFFLWVGFLAPHTGDPFESDDPPEELAGGTPVPAPRHRDRYASEPQPRSPAYDEPDATDKPGEIRNLPRLSPEVAGALEERYRQRLESLLAVDEAVTAIVQALEESGELDNTVIVFTSDNGYLLGEHRIVSEKIYLYEDSIRVPLVIRGPGFPRGAVRNQLVANIDLAPTILDLADAKPGLTLDGRSLLPLAKDPGLEWGRDLLLETNKGLGGIRTASHLYAFWKGGEEELYDLRKDPYELRNLAGRAAYAPMLAELNARLRRLHECAGASCRAGPRLRLDVRSGGSPLSDRCVDAAVRVTVRGVDGPFVRRAAFVLDGRAIGADVVAPFQLTVAAGQVRKGKHRLRVRLTLVDRVVTLDRSLSGCG